jgi:hypothetical protein
MTEKKLYNPPQLFRIELSQEQARKQPVQETALCNFHKRRRNGQQKNL